ncbi:hypothetical protein EW146_g7833 [Bondarzewia mesenterica]|uniref:Amino acid transporter transmembrane domain-containing protein n=1 Tax=Bondarzewia mesenterica TaxID=1095465 RepID=A0A4S4LJA2_9AGAM|nr:hypothetical protein EW146_g7833 [Bondarzewia mesenterica]
MYGRDAPCRASRDGWISRHSEPALHHAPPLITFIALIVPDSDGAVEHRTPFNSVRAPESRRPAPREVQKLFDPYHSTSLQPSNDGAVSRSSDSPGLPEFFIIFEPEIMASKPSAEKQLGAMHSQTSLQKELGSDKELGDSVADVELGSAASDVEAAIALQINLESDHAIKFRTCSWQKTAALLFSEYICLAILSFPWSFSVLGMVPGVIVTIAVAASVQYTSLILWRYCLKHPEVRDVCDIGKLLFGGSELAYNITAVFFVLNNTFIAALHCLVGAKLLNTLSNSAVCSIVFSIITAVICFLFSLPRTLSQLGYLATFSAVTMGLAVLLAIIFSGVQSHPFGYIVGQGPIVTAIPVKGTTFVADHDPFALWAVTIAEIVMFTLCGALMYHYVGNQYITAPAFGSLQPVYKKIAFSFAIPTIVFLGALYASVTARFVFFRIFRNSHHRHSNTIVGWTTWAAILAVTWAVAFVIAEVIPFFSDMLSLMSSLFDGWFGFIFWGMAYLTLYPGAKKWAGVGRSLETALNYLLIVFGFYVLVAGTYVSIRSIVDSYNAGTVGPPFTCASNAI